MNANRQMTPSWCSASIFIGRGCDTSAAPTVVREHNFLILLICAVDSGKFENSEDRLTGTIFGNSWIEPGYSFFSDAVFGVGIVLLMRSLKEIPTIEVYLLIRKNVLPVAAVECGWACETIDEKLKIRDQLCHRQ